MKEKTKMKPKRLRGKALRALKDFVLDRDDHTCQGENCPGGWGLDSPHHIVFRSQSGEDTPGNLITLCIACHNKAHGITVK